MLRMLTYLAQVSLLKVNVSGENGKCLSSPIYKNGLGRRHSYFGDSLPLELIQFTKFYSHYSNRES
jgi:hypothetical protein